MIIVLYIYGAQSGRNTKNRKRGYLTNQSNKQRHASEYEWHCVQCDGFLEKRLLPEDSPV
jgi:hypothetical protein